MIHVLIHGLILPESLKLANSFPLLLQRKGGGVL